MEFEISNLDSQMLKDPIVIVLNKPFAIARILTPDNLVHLRRIR